MSPTSYQTAPPRGVPANVAGSAPSVILFLVVERLGIVQSERDVGVLETVGVVDDHLGVERRVGRLRPTQARLAEIPFLPAWIPCFQHALTATRRRAARIPAHGQMPRHAPPARNRPRPPGGDPRCRGLARRAPALAGGAARPGRGRRGAALPVDGPRGPSPPRRGSPTPRDR